MVAVGAIVGKIAETASEVATAVEETAAVEAAEAEVAKDIVASDLPQEVGKSILEDLPKEILGDDGVSSLPKTVESLDPIEKVANVEKFIDKWNAFRELSNLEKMFIQEKLGWPESKFNKCRIDENGTVQYKTNMCELEGTKHACGVPYECKTININGINIEGVFPVFESVFETSLSPEQFLSKNYANICNEKLREAIQNNPELASQFTEEQIAEILEGDTPSGYNWNHNEEPGKMQLVREEIHNQKVGGAPHTGGNALWGPDSVDKALKGVQF